MIVARIDESLLRTGPLRGRAVLLRVARLFIPPLILLLLLSCLIPAGAVADECRTDTLHIRTGWDARTETREAVASESAGWMVVGDPGHPYVPGAPAMVPFKAWNIEPHRTWSTYPAGRWISAVQSHQNGDVGLWSFQTLFCIPPGSTPERALRLELDVLVDDSAYIYVNDRYVGELGFAVAAPGRHLSVVLPPGLVKEGSNALRVDVTNRPAVYMGLDIEGYLVADRALFIRPSCCACTLDGLSMTSLKAVIPGDIVVEVGETVEIPVELPEPVDAAAISGLTLTLGYDRTLLRPITTSDDTLDLRLGAMAAGWSMSAVDEPGRLTVTLAPPAGGATLGGLGRLLTARFRSFLGDAPATPVSLTIAASGGTCLRYLIAPGLVTLRSCGIGTRSFELLPNGNVLKPAVPDPFGEAATIGFSLAGEGPVRLEIFDPSGALVQVPVDESAMPAGLHAVRLDRGALPAGTYYYRLTCGAWSATRSVAVRR